MFSFCSSGAEITFAFPDDAEREPIEKKLPGNLKPEKDLRRDVALGLSRVCSVCRFNGGSEGEGAPAQTAEGSHCRSEAHLHQPQGEQPEETF